MCGRGPAPELIWAEGRLPVSERLCLVPVLNPYAVLRDREAAHTQLGLFDRAERLAVLKREVNGRQGRFAVRSAATLPLSGIYRDKAGEYDICDVRGKVCF